MLGNHQSAITNEMLTVVNQQFALCIFIGDRRLVITQYLFPSSRRRYVQIAPGFESARASVCVGRHSVGPHVGACCPIRKRERMREKRIPLLFRVLPNSRRKATRSIGNVTKCAASSARLARTDFFYPSDLSRKAVHGILRLEPCCHSAPESIRSSYALWKQV